MCTLNLRPQLLQCAKLQLLHRSFAFSKLLRNLPNAPLLNEALEHHPSLVGRKLFHQTKQPRASLDGLLLWPSARFRRILYMARLTCRALRLIRDRVRSNAEQPGCKRRAPPFVTFQIGQRLVKDLASQIFRFVAVAHSPRNKRINPLEMNVIQFAELRRILLRSLHQQTLPRVFPDHFRRRFARRHSPSARYNCDRRGKVTLLFLDFQPKNPWSAPIPATRLHRPFQSSSTHETNDPLFR